VSVEGRKIMICILKFKIVRFRKAQHVEAEHGSNPSDSLGTVGWFEYYTSYSIRECRSRFVFLLGDQKVCRHC
jgi:hypothetical protein